MLAALGCEVVTARDGAEALTLFHRAREAGTPFDVALMDLTVHGGMGGAELIGRVREIDADLVAIVASGYSADPVLAAPAEHGFDGALHKPYSISDLEALLSSLPRARRAARSDR
jgi:CheY-like chemotaxis protein